MRRKKAIFTAVSFSLILGMAGCTGPVPGENPTESGTKQETSSETEQESVAKKEEETSGKPEETSESQTEPGSEEETEESSSEPETEESETGSEGEGKTEGKGLAFVTDDSWKTWHAEEASKVTFASMRPKALQNDSGEVQAFTPSVSAYTVQPDLGNVANRDEFYFDDIEKAKLAANGFYVFQYPDGYGFDEFFEVYEDNRYDDKPSFVTTDSMMHTYHLYYLHLQKSVEKNDLCEELAKLTDGMLTKSLQQYSVLKGTEWEEAARRNVTFFGVAASLLGSEVKVPEDFHESIDREVKKIMDASGFGASEIVPEQFLGEDYSQYIPRSYYAGDAQLEPYFRVMTWYGRTDFAQKYEQENRCALLMNIALADSENYNTWYNIYEVTSFLVGSSDDLTYLDYLPIITSVYGQNLELDSLVGNDAAFTRYTEAIKGLRDPKINSEFLLDTPEHDVDFQEETKGYRLMGQRFVPDAEVFQNLVHNKVLERRLPEALDIPAAFGSDLALQLLLDQGNGNYSGYLDQMNKMREEVKGSAESRESSVYGAWLNTLQPLLTEKGAGYPSFMTNQEWQKKSLESYLGSWTELKHDTALYAKQPYSIAEDGGGDYIEKPKPDDRGYVEPEPELYDRLGRLTKTTKDGLKELGYLGEKDEETLNHLIELSESLKTISIKELQNQGLTDEEYELIRGYGGSLEHFWDEAIEETNELYPYGNDDQLANAAIVTDVATDAFTKMCLEEAVGKVMTVYVVFPIDGELHIGRGGVYSQYQFTKPISERMTDGDWEKALEPWDAPYYRDQYPDWTCEYHTPEWTMSYKVKAE